jgi:Spy/CpxP family protein refolding chaperone
MSALERLLAAVAPLLDEETLAPFHSAWEFHNYGGQEPDGERMWQELKAAHDQVQQERKVHDEGQDPPVRAPRPAGR